MRNGSTKHDRNESARGPEGLPARRDVAGIPVREEIESPPTTVSRRTALKLMAASTALAASAGCDRKPYREILSMPESPEYRQPGQPLFYASTWTEGRVPYGLMIRTVDGRPVKIEGLPEHPLNRGKSNTQMQASILSLYDPDRLRQPHRGNAPVSWTEADRDIVAALGKAQSVVLVTRSTLGPAERAIVERFLVACPAARHLVHETVHDMPRRRVWTDVFGEDGELVPRLDRAHVIISIDSDFLLTDGDALRNTAAFARGRAVSPQDGRAPNLSRLYVAESAMTVTGSNADHRVPLKPSLALPLVRALSTALAEDHGALRSFATAVGLDARVLETMAGDLAANRGRAVVLAGPHLPGAVHAELCLLNREIGACGSTLEWNPTPHTLPVDDPGDIAAALEAGPDVLLLLGINLVHDRPDGRALISRAGLSVGHGQHVDETLAACSIALPSTHNLESWNDATPALGLRSLCQPVIGPLFDSRQEAESLLVWTRTLAPDDAELRACADFHDFVRARFLDTVLSGAADPRLAWEDVLRHGLAGTAVTVPFPPTDAAAAERLAAVEPAAGSALELVVLPHHALVDGRHASNAWLLELPDPVSRLVWDNALALGPATAERLGLRDGDVVAVQANGNRVELPVLVQPGVAPDVGACTLGHGRGRAGDFASGVGVNVAPLLGAWGTAASPYLVPVGTPQKTGATHQLVRTQQTFSMHGRPIILHASAEQYAADPQFVRQRVHLPDPVQLHDQWDYSRGHKWVMAVDLNACVGCNACVTACQAENNIPVVGKEECSKGREMHWMRIDRYEGGSPDNPDVYQQPMLCQHCDNAPCENVCPVNATAHSPEGLNEQVYNRCVGTRYCANNCPYKVRRFNFFNYTKQHLKDPVQELVNNPQVTVRSRGVMEKCTFCIQRINEVKFRAKNAGRDIVDGEVRTACEQACPATAIVFGDENDPNSRVAALKRSALAYHVLGELNVRPNVDYLARVRNNHPELPRPDGEAAHGAHGVSQEERR